MSKGEHKTCVMFTGGLDSAVLVADAAAEGKNPLCIVFNDNSPRHNLKRRPAIYAVMEHVGLDPKSNLIELPNEKPPLVRNGQGVMEMPGNFLNMVTYSLSYCHSYGIDYLELGHNKDNHVRGYSDGDKFFFDSVCRLYNKVYSTYMRVRLPFYNLDKHQIIQRAVELELPLSKTYSCDSYVTPGLTHCGVCRSCSDRIREENLYLASLHTTEGNPSNTYVDTKYMVEINIV